MIDDNDIGVDQPDGSQESDPDRDDRPPADSEFDSVTENAGDRTAQVQTTHRDAATVAAAVRPDNTDSMRTTVTNGHITTHIERETTGGLESSVDDYVVNVTVAETVINAVYAAVDANESATVVDQFQHQHDT